METAGLYPFQPRDFIVDGHRMSYLDEGRGRVVLMLHGNPTWSFYYRNLVLALRDRYRLIVPDHLGCGYSDKPRDYPYRLSNHIDNVIRLMDHLEIQRHSLVVHDWGGAIGMGYAARRPVTVDSLTILNTAAFRSRRIPFRIRVCRTPLLGPLMVQGLNLFARGALHMAVTSPLPRAVRRWYLLPYDSWGNRRAIMRFVEDIPLDGDHPSWSTLLEAEGAVESFGATPALILWGGKDFCFNDHFYEEWRRRLPGARSVYLEEAGHYVLEDAPAGTAEAVSTFLDDHLKPGGEGT